MNDFAEFNDGHVRLAALKLLVKASNYKLNDSLLTQSVTAFGLPCTRDQMRGHLTWMAEQRLVTNELVGSDRKIIVATITERGAEAATGAVTVPGVQRPSPGE